MARTVRVGTRGSALALWQTHWTIDRLKELEPDINFEVMRIKTQGDIILDVSLNKIGGKGLFTKEIENALFENQIDLAVHSLKDLPTELPEGLTIGAITERVDPRDALISKNGKGLADLPEGAKVGTSSLRRVSQLKNLRPDLECLTIRGNVDTRLRKLVETDLDAIVMAAAGLARLGFSDRIIEYLPVEVSLPAVGQGALGIEIRQGDAETASLVGRLNHRLTEAATTAERALLRRLGGGCQVPIGAHGSVKGARMTLLGLVASPEGDQIIRSSLEGPAERAQALGVELAEKLIEMGAGKILSRVLGYEVQPGGA